MGFRLGQPPDRDDLARWPKVARQHAMARLGLPVPAGFVVDPGVGLDAAAIEWIAGHSELIARSAHHHEDTDETSGAGLGLSIAGLHSLADVEAALVEIQVASGDASSLILIQIEVPRRTLVVAVRGRGEAEFYIEVHGPDAGPEPLADGRTPDWSGPLRAWDDPAVDKLAAIAEAAARTELERGFGIDLELVVDPRGEPWIVQARPLARPLHPDWPQFLTEVLAGGGHLGQLHGQLKLDGEHNPAPLSPAHAWVMQRLASARPGSAGDPVVLAGWLYVRSLPRDLLSSSSSSPMGVHAALAWLRDDSLVRARAALTEFDQLLAGGPPVATALARAESMFVAMIDEYVGILVPARRAAFARSEKSITDAPGTPTSLRERASFLDVLPTVWDIASPTLAEVSAATRAPATDERELPTDESVAARMLGEWDDHRFALGLAPLRRVWRWIGARFGLGDRVFWLDGDELVRLGSGALADDELAALLDARAERSARQSRLEPPARIIDGVPQPSPIGGLLRGLAVGTSVVGVIAQRADLRALLADPPPPGAILCIPALTAQAAVALDSLAVRAVCTEYGGALAHGVLMARELGLSALIGCRGCTKIPNGTQARLDTRTRRLAPFRSGPRP